MKRVSGYLQSTSVSVLAVLLTSGLAMAQCKGGGSAKLASTADKSGSACGKDIVATALAAGSFNTLAEALKAADLVETLQGEGPFTVFAPTDEAFAKLPAGTLDALVKDPAKLRSILKYHVVPGKVMASDVVKLTSAQTALGQPVTIKTGGGVSVNNARVIKTDVAASNGVIHVIDAVILPPADVLDVAAEAGQFKTLVAAVNGSGLADTLRSGGPYTVFAPTDAAFAKLPPGTVEALLKDLPKLRQILKYHVLSGKVMADQAAKLDSARTILGQEITLRTASPLHVNNAQVLKADIAAANGVIHVIDSVILPKDDIIDVARNAGPFKTLLAAIDAAGLADALRGEGPLTVFAPTDEAFAKLPAGTVESLLKNPDKLKAILTYHVVAGRVMAEDVVKLDKAKTLQGQSVRIDASNGVKVDNARVVKADVKAANGVIHVIDTVMLPR